MAKLKSGETNGDIQGKGPNKILSEIGNGVMLQGDGVPPFEVAALYCVYISAV